jgi:hypothetical protein
MRRRVDHVRTRAAAIFCCACVFNSVCVAAVAADAKNVTELSMDLRDQGPPFRGWGTSLAWWARGIGDWPDDTLDRVVKLVTDPRDGLGLNVFRYNIGGGDDPSHHHMRRWGDVPGFKASDEAPYDWTADAAQRRVLLKLIKASSDPPIVEAFSNSPPWWMTISRCSAGAAGGGPNLAKKDESAFVGYLADVVQHYRDQWGVTFGSLSPMNEPDANWWTAGHDQEGLHVDRDQQARLIRLARRALDERGLRQTIVSATDAHATDDCLASLLSFDRDTLAALGRVNTHSYHGTKHVDVREAAAVRGKPLWQSETGPLDFVGTEHEKHMLVARRIVHDLNTLRPEVWCTWQIIDAPGWGVLHALKDKQDFQVTELFYTLATFTRNIRPGDRFIKLDRDDLVAAVSASRGEVILVLVNSRPEERTFRVALHGAQQIVNEIEATCASATADLERAPAELRDAVVTVSTPPASVTCVRVHAKL